MHQKIKLQEDYQTARRVALLAYANWSCAVFGFWGATADKVGAVEATVFVGFTMKNLNRSVAVTRVADTHNLKSVFFTRNVRTQLNS